MKQITDINSKFEARNPKQIQMTKIQNSKQTQIWDKHLRTPRLYFIEADLFLSFGHLNFGFVSDFDIRISCFLPPSPES